MRSLRPIPWLWHPNLTEGPQIQVLLKNQRLANLPRSGRLSRGSQRNSNRQ